MTAPDALTAERQEERRFPAWISRRHPARREALCGGCRVSVGGKPARGDGPEFDGHQVDFDLLTLRNRAYMTEEKLVLERHECSIGLGE